MKKNLLFRVTLLGLTAMVAACAQGLRPGDTSANRPSARFEVNSGYQEAYRRLRTWARQCHAGSVWKGSWNIEGNVYTDRDTAELDITGNGITVLRATIDGHGGASKVEAIVWGQGIWDQRELDALQQSVARGSPVCR
jgi:hypothetical protein